MRRPTHYRRRFSRIGFFREWMARRALRRRKPDFSLERPMVSIIGDEVSDVIRAEQIYERDILECIRHRLLDTGKAANQVAIDVGANIGNHSLFLADIFKHVIAFEPNPLARSILQINLEMNRASNVEVRPVGLSDTPGRAMLTFNRRNLGAASAHSRAGPIDDTAEIELVVGDQSVDPALPVGLIKIDVEGAEDAVLRGLENVIRKHQPLIMVEQWADVIDARMGTSPSLLFLQELGYSALELRPAFGFAGKWGKITAMLLGRFDYRLVPADTLEKREYRALFFTPPSYVFPPQS